jgi:hypothetical protein
MTATVGNRIWHVPRDQFVAIWNSAAALDDAASAVRALAGGPVPRWAVMARAAALRKEGVSLKILTAAGQQPTG